MIKNKLCFVIHALSPGGMERVMSQLVSYFSQNDGLEIHLVLYGRKRDIFYKLPASVVIHRPDFEFSNSQRIWDTFRTLFFLRSIVKSIRPVAILSFGEFWNNLVLLALYGLNFPVYVSDRSKPGKNLGFLHNLLKKWLYPKASGYIAQTKTAGAIALSKKLNGNVQVIGNPIRKISFGSPEEKANIVLTVGRLIKTKHVDQLIRLFAKINKADWQLVIVGGDAQKQNLMLELEQLVKNLNMTDRVLLAGTVSDVDSYYKRSRIFAFTSSSEGFPNVLGEAMSAGLPVVAFDCVAGPSEMITDGENGFLVPVFDYMLFEERLRLLMDDGVLREQLGNKARQSIQRFSVDSIGEQYLSFMLRSQHLQ